MLFSTLSANPTKWWNTQTICRLLPTIYLIVVNNFMRLALKELTLSRIMFKTGPAYFKNLGV